MLGALSARRVCTVGNSVKPNKPRIVPQVLVIDGVASPNDAAAIRAAVQRGVSVVAACLGQDLQQLLANPDLSPLLGGTQPAADVGGPQRCAAVNANGCSDLCHQNTA